MELAHNRLEALRRPVATSEESSGASTNGNKVQTAVRGIVWTYFVFQNTIFNREETMNPQSRKRKYEMMPDDTSDSNSSSDSPIRKRRTSDESHEDSSDTTSPRSSPASKRMRDNTSELESTPPASRPSSPPANRWTVNGGLDEWISLLIRAAKQVSSDSQSSEHSQDCGSQAPPASRPATPDSSKRKPEPNRNNSEENNMPNKRLNCGMDEWISLLISAAKQVPFRFNDETSN